MQQRATVGGPTFIRLLARLADVDVAPFNSSLPDRLSQWLDWTRALALSSALDAPPAAAAASAPAVKPLLEQCTTAREALIAAIRSEGKPADITAFRQRYLVHQRAMQSATGRLRGPLRDALSQVSPEMARLAAVDAVMEQALSPREHALLAKVPDLLERRFERLREAVNPAWLNTFRRDMQSVLLAELDVRFQPVEGLLAALRTH